MKLLQVILIPLLLFLSINITQAQSKHRENFRLAYWTEYVGSYRIEPNRYIVIGLPWGGDLSYLDTGTGSFGRLKYSSQDMFVGEDGLQVTFIRTTQGRAASLKWLKKGSPEQKALA